MAGEDLEIVWRDLCRWKGDPVPGAFSILPRYGKVCPAMGCHTCTDSDCTYAGFIRMYLRHPRCD